MKLLLTCALLAMPPALNAATYTGTLDTSSGGLVGTAAWGIGSSLSWTVTNEGYGGYWSYGYTFTVASKAISHIILETSPSFGPDNLLGVTDPYDLVGSFEVGNYVQDGSNQLLPGPVRGIKFDTQGDPLSLTFSFLSDRAPVWGDWYGKDGKDGGDWVTLTNAGFLADDPLAAASSGALDGHLLVPDSVPEPSTALFLGCVGMAALLRRRC